MGEGTSDHSRHVTLKRWTTDLLKLQELVGTSVFAECFPFELSPDCLLI